MSLYVTTTGLTKDCWTRYRSIHSLTIHLYSVIYQPVCLINRLAEHLRSVFGDPDLPTTASSNSNIDDIDPSTENEYPEPEVDAMRTQRDLMLEKYIQVLYYCTSTRSNHIVRDILMYRRKIDVKLPSRR